MFSSQSTVASAPTVLVTGASMRLGEQICRTFAVAGWTVWCHYQHSEGAANVLCADLRSQNRVAYAVQADLADAVDCARLMAHIVGTTGPLTCLVNNASSFEPDSATELDVQAARHQLQVNLLAPMQLSSLMAKNTPEDSPAGQHSIIHILDQKVFNLNPDYFSYTLSKLALERSVALQAQALAPSLRVCGLAPGLMYLSGPQSQENFDAACTVNLMRQATDPAQVAASCLFLAENPCITGITLTVDNGQHLVPLPRDVMFVVDDLLKVRHGH
jgi:NAD(P)-dependent dehydrogenase (short-subunit alcohol dehydrogenase family)